jgi:nucleotide-binding universal stress UspA family protein
MSPETNIQKPEVGPSNPAPVPTAAARTEPPRAFKRILVAADDSPPSRAALSAAAALAGRLGAEVVLVNVMLTDCGYTPEFEFVEPEIRAKRAARAGAFLDRAAAQMPPNARAEKVLREGDPAAAILDAATVYAADLIVMGTHGRGRIAQTVLGSVAAAVVRRAGCPVLLVGQGA